MEEYTSKTIVPERVYPNTVALVDFDGDIIHEVISRKKYFLCLISRLKSSESPREDQVVPSWIGLFSKVLKKDSPKCTSTVLFLPSIGQSPEKVNTVKKEFFQVKVKTETLGITTADLVLDHNIHHRVLEILMNPRNQDIQKFINLKMGAFYASCIFIAVIGK